MTGFPLFATAAVFSPAAQHHRAHTHTRTVTVETTAEAALAAAAADTHEARVHTLRSLPASSAIEAYGDAPELYTWQQQLALSLSDSSTAQHCRARFHALMRLVSRSNSLAQQQQQHQQ
eukprot:4603-Heterococcus_DN1.PRE.4